MKTIEFIYKGLAIKPLLTLLAIIGIHSISAAGTKTYTGEAWAQGHQPWYYDSGVCRDTNCDRARSMAYDSARLKCYEDGAIQCDYVTDAQTYFKDYGCGAELTICYMSVVFKKTK